MGFAVGDRVSFEGREAVVVGIVPGTELQYRLRYLKPTDARHVAGGDELQRLEPFDPLAVGAKVEIAGIAGVVEAVLPDGLHRVCCRFQRAGVQHEQIHLVERWRLAVG